MKKFIVKTSFFVLPFIIGYVIFLSFGTQDKGDLYRIGSLFDDTGDYRDIFKDAFTQKIEYDELSSINLEDKSYDIMTFGDSFSQQKNNGYQNYLSKNSDLEVLHYNKSCDALQLLYVLYNNGFFDKIKVKYILLESVERYVTDLLDVFNPNETVNYYEIKEKKLANNINRPRFFSPSTVKFIPNNFLHLFDDNAFFSEVYKVKTTKELFSVKKNNLLFLDMDLEGCLLNNDFEKVKYFNDKVNTLSKMLNEKGVKLIYLPAPDKFDAYYEYISKKENYPKPLFFNHLLGLEKNYIYIDSKSVIEEVIRNKKDAYFYDETHWSPIVSEAIANKILEQVFFIN